MQKNNLKISKKSPKNLHWFKTVGWQYLVFQRLASKLMRRFTQATYAPVKNWQIRTFIQKYKVDMQEALEKDYKAYKNFNAFFTRALEANARPIDSYPQGFISPADGQLSQFASINDHTLIQAKEKYFTTQALLGQAPHTANAFENGYFATVYLAPNNYHRVHMPIKGTLKSMRFIPGKLFSVNLNTAAQIDELFAKNERLVLFFDTELGPMALVMVGAMLVSSMSTRWSGVVGSQGKIENTDYSESNPPLVFEKGEEIGHFNMGSTVVLLMSNEVAHLEWSDSVYEGCPIQMGQPLASFKPL